jgi:predicted dehydrogenase
MKTPRSRSSLSATPASSRRNFLKGALALGAFAALRPSSALAASARRVAANSKVNLAVVGIGNRGGEVLRAFVGTGLANIVALCDTELGAKHTTASLAAHPGAKQFRDFRVMLDRMGAAIDAVAVCTPDHSHFAVCMHAMKLGKHVFVEKPMAHSFLQTALLMEAEKKSGVACQMGNQGHSEAAYFQFKAWTDAGVIRDVTKITAFMNNPRRWHGMKVDGPFPAEALPEGLDWDCWLSTAAKHPFNAKYLNGEWRSWFDFGNGALGDWGAHIIDTAHEFLQLGLPTEVTPTLIEGHSPFIFPQATTLVFKFPARGARPPVELSWLDGQANLPELPANFGSAVVDPNIPPPSVGKIDTKKHPPGKVIYGGGLTIKGGSHASTLQILDSEAARAVKLPEVPKSPSNHFANFLLACRGDETCRSNFAVAGPLCQAMALGILAQRVNAPLQFDPASGRITNHAVAHALLAGVPPRPEWAEYYRV